MPYLIYVHGFNSSELSHKSQLVAQRMVELGLGDHFECPRLPWQPAKAINLLQQCIEQKQHDGHSVVLIGSSLGGFYAAYLSQQFDLPAILVNPAVEAPSLLRHYLGEQVNPYTGERYMLEERHMSELESMDHAVDDQSRFWLMVQKADEVLNANAALARFPHVGKLTCEEGGDHSFAGFDRFIDDILRFSGILK